MTTTPRSRSVRPTTPRGATALPVEDLSPPTASTFLTIKGCTLMIEDGEKSGAFARRVGALLVPLMPDELDIVTRITTAIAGVTRLTPMRITRAIVAAIGRTRARGLIDLGGFDPPPVVEAALTG